MNTKEWRSKNRQKLVEYERTARERNPDVGRRKVEKYRKNNRQKIAAKRAVGQAVKIGRLKPPNAFTCVNPECSKQAQHYHHWSYEKEHWLNVIPLCKSCHHSLHGGAWELVDPKQYAVISNPVDLGRKPLTEEHKRKLRDKALERYGKKRLENYADNL